MRFLGYGFVRYQAFFLRHPVVIVEMTLLMTNQRIVMLFVLKTCKNTHRKKLEEIPKVCGGTVSLEYSKNFKNPIWLNCCFERGLELMGHTTIEANTCAT